MSSSRYQAPSRPTLRTFELAQPRPRLPISPPETERNAPAHSAVSDPKVVSAVATPDGAAIGDKEESSPYRHLRRAPSITYHNQATGFTRPQQSRSPRWLLVVLPPASCVEGEPTLGHTLATGAPGRLQSGVLVPLFPTIYGQLAAIAKEFNFPSTAGVCLYLHVSEPGVNIAPRISDDAWQLLWNSYFSSDDSNSPVVPSGLPICGQIEFDVDVRKGRWYESWLSGQEHRITLEEAIPPSVAQTMTRWYQEHREAASHDASESLINDNATTAYTAAAPVRSKPIPRPLTLSTRSDGLKSLAKYKLVGNSSREPDGIAESMAVPSNKRAPSRLSPVVQVEESASNQKDIDTLVRNWRATTPMAPAIPRTGPAGESIPDTYDLPFSDIDMDDFQFSVSSPGPSSYHWLPSAELDGPLYSVGLDRRMLGSVVLTPSVATSFGPDDSFPTPTFSNASRFPSPDIAARMIEDSPATPSTATTWGAPLSWPTTAASFARLQSPDMAARGFTSVPNTPSTATSWGAPLEWPASPASVYRANSPDIGRRAFGSTPPTPSTATSWGAPEVWPPSPIEATRPSTPDIAARTHSDEVERSQVYRLVWPFFDGNAPAETYQFVWPYLNHEAQPFQFVWPYLSREAQVYRLVWPYLNHEEQPYPLVWPFLSQQMNPASGTMPSSQREISPSKMVWPYFTPQASAAAAPLRDLRFSAVHPSTSMHEKVSPNLVFQSQYNSPGSAENGRVQKHVEEKICPSYAYPNIVIYAKTSGQKEQATEDYQGSYGFFDLYPAVYPAVVPYPARYECDTTVKKALPAPAPVRFLERSTALSPCYPFFDLYPATYPSLVIYPPTRSALQAKARESKAAPTVHLASNYPHLVLYNSVYPHIEIYPSVALSLPTKKTLSVKTPTRVAKEELCSTRLQPSYPSFNLYPALYPALEIYPDCHQAPSRKTSSRSVELEELRLPSYYPCLTIYSPVYPHLEIYPSLASATRKQPQIKAIAPSNEMELCNTVLPSFYPNLVIYPSTYPFLEIYPTAPLTRLELSVTPRYRYPNIVIYEPVHGNRGVVSKSLPEPLLPVRLELAYPIFDLYPAPYPHLEIYPPVTRQPTELEPVSLPDAVCNYPTLVIYPATQHLPRHKKAPSVSISIRMSETTIRSMGSRTRRGSNQWALASASPAAVPRLHRGSVNTTDACVPVASSTRKPAARPRMKPRKSHSDLIKEVFAQMAMTEVKTPVPNGASGLRRVASARVDEVPQKLLHRSRTVPTPTPPVPRKARGQPSPGSIGGPSEAGFPVASSVDAIVAAMNALDEVPVTPRSEGLGPLGRRVSKLDKNRYPSRIW
ncbi:hypothetical protein M408DRAFT_328794 [Serendipita vermifera MAFF 305830]|uniref:Uncharacterized protein n=1 Tax=Serendipita vermifera MAFF 305830 TaxID=933852 RepID=A0A0C3AYE7_SERVB|nr:hypothetical protein M408DRAFT_328794 [Serendipita vermifera MAFF 305830]